MFYMKLQVVDLFFFLFNEVVLMIFIIIIITLSQTTLQVVN